MSEDLAQVEEWIGGLMRRFSPGERVKLGSKLAAELRRSQAQRIAAQKNPDGSSYAPRKIASSEPIRAKKGRIKRRVKARAMFAKLRRAQFLTAEATANEIAVGFKNPVTARVARVHQDGLSDRVSKRPGAHMVTYPRRVLLGLTAADSDMIMDLMLRQIDG